MLSSRINRSTVHCAAFDALPEQLQPSLPGPMHPGGLCCGLPTPAWPASSATRPAVGVVRAPAGASSPR